MKAIYVDDEKWMIKRFRMECETMEGLELIACFSNSQKALEFAKENSFQCAFLDINMPGMDGFSLAEQLREIHPGLIIIYISAYDQYMADAFKHQNADYYVLKPYTNEELAEAVARAELLSMRQKKRIYMETFGNFNVYIDGTYLEFKSRIAKELMALLVDKRGTSLTNKEAFQKMWENLTETHENMTRIRKGVQKLRITLEEAGIADILLSARSEHRLNTSMFDCDYYDFLDGNQEAINKYRGEYMLEYSWGEETNAQLHDMYWNRKEASDD